MSYSNDIRYLITAESRSSVENNHRYIGLYYDDKKEDIRDFAIFFTVDGYLDYFKPYKSKDDAENDLKRWETKYSGINDRRYDSLRNLKIIDIIAANGNSI